MNLQFYNVNDHVVIQCDASKNGPALFQNNVLVAYASKAIIYTVKNICSYR